MTSSGASRWQGPHGVKSQWPQGFRTAVVIVLVFVVITSLLYSTCPTIKLFIWAIMPDWVDNMVICISNCEISSISPVRDGPSWGVCDRLPNPSLSRSSSNRSNDSDRAHNTDQGDGVGCSSRVNEPSPQTQSSLVPSGRIEPAGVTSATRIALQFSQRTAARVRLD